MADMQARGTNARVEFLHTYDVARRADIDKLHAKAVGLAGVLFLTLTGSAPISAMLFNVPIQVGFGEGIGAPAAFIVATIVLVIFSIGYAAMARKVTAAGGFYSYISHGLGRPLGMAMGFAAVFAYAVFEASLTGGFSYFLNLKIYQLTGVNIAWPWLALFMIVLIAALTYFDVKLSTVVLGTALILEVITMLIFDVGVFAHAGSGARIQLAAINPVNAFNGFPAQGKLAAGAAGIGLFFAFWSWVGFEMAPNYGEESRDPKRIVPLALFISVIGLGIFYTWCAWSVVSGYPTIHSAIAQAQSYPLVFFFLPASHFVGTWLATMMSWLILTGSFACGMAFHNTAARYFYALGRERLLWPTLGRTHHRFKSPYVASFTQSLIAAIVMALFAIFMGSNNPTLQAYDGLYALMAVMGTIVILAAQAIVSVAIIVYYEREHPNETNWITTRIAPAIAFVAQAIVLYLLFSNISFLGGGLALANWLGPIDLIVFLIGLAGALYLRTKDPKKYEIVGRLIYEGVEEGLTHSAPAAEPKSIS